MPLFGKSQKTPAEVVRISTENLLLLQKGEAKKREKTLEELIKMLGQMKTMCVKSSPDQEPNAETVSLLAQEMYNSNLIYLLIKNLNIVDFESKKDVVSIINAVLRRQIGTRNPTVEHICTKPDMLFLLLNGYDRPEVALNCGNILRECIRYEAIARIILYSEEFYSFFKHVEGSAFDVASDAFTTFKELLTRHKPLVADFLERNYDKFFEHYQNLLNSDNYVTRRQSLKLLGELLLDRHNFNVMTRFISNPENLKKMMNLLREKSRNIQFEAFHVFKVFVANPNKPKPITDILLRNRERLVEFLTNFHTDRQDDEQFNDEKSYLIKQIRDMRPPAAAAAATSNALPTTPQNKSPGSSSAQSNNGVSSSNGKA